MDSKVGTPAQQVSLHICDMNGEAIASKHKALIGINNKVEMLSP